jgi:glycosyltransferase involved in cell wall biosynthesis
VPASLERFGDRVQRHRLTDWPGWFRLMARMDIALAPLEMNNVFCRAKSEIKFVEAGALGLPVVASNIDPYRDSMSEGRNGFLASDEKEWTQALTALIQDAQLRTDLGEAARQTVMQSYSPRARTTDLSNLLAALEQRLKLIPKSFRDLSC